MLSKEEIRKILCVTFFQINGEYYEKHKEKINLMFEIVHCLDDAKLKAESIIENELNHKDKDEIFEAAGFQRVDFVHGPGLKNIQIEEDGLYSFISEAAKVRNKFLTNTGFKYDEKDVLKCLTSLEENELVKNFAKALNKEDS